MASSPTMPWSPDEIRQKVPSWSLEGDAKLLEFMQNISADLERRATKTTNSILRLGLDLDRTNVSLGNVTNQLSALQHSQFVENRVYEDDETLANESEVPVNDEVEVKTKYDPIETLTKLLNNSMSVLERYYEKVSIDMDDSDEEDDSARSVIYRPKVPYDARPLPYIIGSREWTEKWHIGLCDSDEDYSGDEKEEEFSESSESASISASPASNAPTISESEISAWGLQRNIIDTYSKRQDDSYGSSEEDLSAAEKRSLQNPRPLPNNGVYTVPQNVDLMSDQSESAKQYYVHKPKQKERGLFDESTDESTDSELYNVKGKSGRTVPLPVPVMRRDNIISNIISDEPPPDLDVVDKLEKPTVDLFCESEDEALITEPQESTNAINKKEDTVASNIRKKTVNLFNDDDFDSFMQELNSKAQQKVGISKEPARNLFEESSGDEDTETKAVTKVKSENRRLVRRDAGQISEGKSSIKTPENISKTFNTHTKFEKKLEDISDTLFKRSADKIVVELSKESKNDSSSVKGERILFDEDPDEKNDFSDILRLPSTVERTLITNLFDDEPPDDDFDSLFKPRRQGVESTKKEAPEEKKLFDDSGSDDSSGLITKEKGHLTASSGRKDVKAEQEASIEKNTRENMFGPNQGIHHLSSECKQGKSSEKPLKLFDDEFDADSADLFGDITSQPLQTAVEEKLENIPPSNKKETLPQPGNRREQKDLEQQALPEIPLICDGKALTDSCEQVLNEQSLKPSSESVKGALPNIFLDDYILDGDLKSDAERESNECNVPDNKNTEEYSHGLEKNEEINHDKNEMSDILEKTNSYLLSPKPRTTPRQLFSSSLFNDIPPDDGAAVVAKRAEAGENVLGSNDSTEKINTTKTVQYTFDTDNNAFVKQTPQNTPELQASAFNYNNISLFHDTPPDDDFEATPQDGKKLHSIFYDDFSETIIPPQIDTKPKSLSSYIFDEPPPDGTCPELLDKSRRGSSSSIGQRGKEVGSKIFYEPPEDDFDPTPPVAIPSAERILGEQQLAPRRPVLLKSELEISSVVDQLCKQVTEIPEDITPKSNRVPKKLNSNLKINVAALLPGAKWPQLKRNEEKNPCADVLSNETSGVDAPDSCVKIIQRETDPNLLQSLNRSRAKIQVKRRPSTRKGRQENYRRSQIENNENLAASEDDRGEHEPAFVSLPNTVVEKTESLTCKGGTAPLFSKSDSVVEAPLDKTAADSESSAIFSENEPPEDIFTPALNPSIEKQTPKLFFEEEDEVDDDFLTIPTPVVTTPTQSPLNSKLAVATEQSKNKSGHDNPRTTMSIFGDESGDDDLFEESLKNSDKESSKNTLPASTKVTESIKKQSIVSKSIFGSDDDEDYDLFGGISASKSKMPVKSSANKLETSTNSLFDDNDDDDDDLFSGASSKPKNIPQTISRKMGTKKLASQLQQTGTKKDFNDPLADLFKN